MTVGMEMIILSILLDMHLLNTMELIKERTEPTNTRIYDPESNEYIVKYIDLEFKIVSRINPW